jgi:hypothetical protein
MQNSLAYIISHNPVIVSRTVITLTTLCDSVIYDIIITNNKNIYLGVILDEDGI